jgi:hypothetical protein
MATFNESDRLDDQALMKWTRPCAERL